MKRVIKWALIILVPLILLIVLFGLYVAVVAGVNIPGLDSAFRAEPNPPSAEALAMAAAVESRIDEAVSDKSGFYVELNNEDLTALLIREIGTDINLRDVTVEIREANEVGISASLNGRIGVPISGTVGATLTKGLVELEVRKLNFTGLPLPGSAKSELEGELDKVLDVNELLRRAGAPLIQELLFEDGRIAITGVQQAGDDVSPVTKESLLAAAGSGSLSSVPVLPAGSEIVPPGRTGAEAGADIMLAIGDSLAANEGVSDPREGYVSRFHAYMEGQLGRTLGLVNYGISGESTLSIYQSGQLQKALDELKRANADSATRVSVVTLDLGSNDLIAHVNSAECHADPTGEVCQRRVNSALASFRQNFREIIELVNVELEPGTEFYVMKSYNPFAVGLGIPLEAFANGVIDRLNEAIGAEAGAIGAKVADPQPMMRGNTGHWTHILEGDIHPTADGYQVLAYSFVLARGQ